MKMLQWALLIGLGLGVLAGCKKKDENPTPANTTTTQKQVEDGVKNAADATKSAADATKSAAEATKSAADALKDANK